MWRRRANALQKQFLVTPEAGSPSASILLVDDTRRTCSRSRRCSRPLGARIVEATSGHEAIDHVARESFACALLDVQMPGMDGFEAAGEDPHARRRPRAAHHLLTAIHRDEGFVKRGYGAGAADRHITKPFDADVVRARVAPS